MRSAKASLCALVLLAACGNDDDVSLPCDVTRRACQHAVFRATAETRGQTDAKIPPVRVISRDQLAAELRASIQGGSDQRAPEETRKQDQGQRALSLLGLMPPPSQQSADDAYIEQSVATIAAYYSHGSHDVTVIADQTMDVDDATITLSHEFVHALQDQRENLSRLRSTYVQTTDDDVALTSLVEGEATWLSYATYFEDVRELPLTRINYPKLFGSILSRTLEAIEESSAPLIDMSELMPYPIGGRHVAELHVNEGLDSVRALFKAPPLALRAWTEEPPTGLPFELDCELPEASADYTRIDTDHLGFGGLMAFRIAQGEAGTTAYDNAQHWRADQIGSYASDDDAEQVAVVWRIRLDNSASARALAAFASASGSLQASVQDTAVVISAATDSTLLSQWKPGEGCPAATKARTHSGRGALLGLKNQLGISR